MLKHSPTATAHATALVTAIIFVFCRLAFALFPDLSLSIGQAWFHGLQMGLVGGYGLSLEAFFLGLVTATGGAWLVGYLWASLHNLLLKESVV